MGSIARKEDTRVAGHMPGRPSSFREKLLGLSRVQKRSLQLTADVILLWASLWLAFYIRLGGVPERELLQSHIWLFCAAPAVTIPLLLHFNLYRAVVRYLGQETLARAALALTLATACLAVLMVLIRTFTSTTALSVLVIHWLLSLMLLGGVRIAMRQYFGRAPLHRWSAVAPRTDLAPIQTRVAIYGAGTAGNQLHQALRTGSRLRAVAFIDDDPALTGRILAGLPIYHSASVGDLVERLAIEQVLLAIPSASRRRRKEIVEHLARHSVEVRTIPTFADLASGRVKLQDVRDVEIADLLGRDPVQPDERLFRQCIEGKVVMVTGAGGSIGSELSRQILQCRPTALILFEHSEFNLYSIQLELDAINDQAKHRTHLVSVLGSVRDANRLFEVMTTWQVDTVYHAAAYKHVPMVERNSAEGILNNVFGTLHSAQAAIRAGVSNFVLISTDKAVRPTNIMGSTKRVAELILQGLADEQQPLLYGCEEQSPVLNQTRFTMVRFGNVLGSSGSVIPLFRRQIQEGGPVTVTHPEITRYFMTIPEAAQLVIQAGSMGRGGDVFVLDMGEPVKIAELAVKMIQLSGLTVRSPENPEGDIELTFVGLRPGEKLYEELLIGENVSPTDHPMIMCAHENKLDWESVKEALRQLEAAIKADDSNQIRHLFLALVDGYAPTHDIVDVHPLPVAQLVAQAG